MKEMAGGLSGNFVELSVGGGYEWLLMLLTGRRTHHVGNFMKTQNSGPPLSSLFLSDCFLHF